MGWRLKTSLHYADRIAGFRTLGRIKRAKGGPFESLAAMIRPENKITLGFVEGLDDKIQVFERRVYSLRDEDCLRRKIVTCSLPEL